MWRLVRRSYARRRDDLELWGRNRELGWRDSFRYLIWPAFKRAFENRRKLPPLFARHPQVEVHRLRSDRQVRAFLASLAAQAPARRTDATAISETGT
jgi:hypothetical protein